MWGAIMKRFSFGAATLLFFTLLLDAKEFIVENGTSEPIKVTWKSNSYVTKTRDGVFVLQPGKIALANSFDDACIHHLLAETVDGKIKSRSRPFCGESYVLITFIDKISWFTRKVYKAMDIKVEALDKHE